MQPQVSKNTHSFSKTKGLLDPRKSKASRIHVVQSFN